MRMTPCVRYARGLKRTQAVSKLIASTPICARVGIHTGLVVVGETGHGDLARIRRTPL